MQNSLEIVLLWKLQKLVWKKISHMNIIRSAFKLKALDCSKKKINFLLLNKSLLYFDKRDTFAMLELEILFL